jgi:uncharacterized protein (TIGR03437 family)
VKPVLGIIFLCAGAQAVFGQTPVVAAGGVLNGASFSKGQAVAPGSLVSIFGTDLASSNAVADTIPLSTSLGNVTVTFNGTLAPLNGVFHNPANGDQINAQLPWELLPAGTQSGSAQVVVNRNGVISPAASVQLAAVTPGIFSVQFGVGQAIAINNDGTLAQPAGSIPGLTTRPAKINDPTAVIVLATGLGPVDPPVKTGNNANDGQLHKTVTMPVVMVGGVQAKVLFSGMSPQFVGVNQVNIVIAPGTPTGNAVPLQIQMGGITTTDQVTIAVTN